MWGQSLHSRYISKAINFVINTRELYIIWFREYIHTNKGVTNLGEMKVAISYKLVRERERASN